MAIKDQSEEEAVAEDLDSFRLPPAVAELLSKLGPEGRVSLQAYLEMNNHFGEYPLHLTLREIDKTRPGTTEEVFTESATEARWDRQNRRIALLSEIGLKTFSMLFASGFAVFGALSAYRILSAPVLSWVQLAAGLSLLVFCIGGTAAAAAFAANSGVRIKPQTDIQKTSDESED